MADYSRAIETAKRLIADKGELCLWACTQKGQPEDATPWLDAGEPPSEYPDTPIVFLPLSRQWSEFFRYLKGTEVQAGSVMGLMAATPFTPKVTDTVTRKDGTVLRPITIDPLSPSGDVILYTIEFRK